MQGETPIDMEFIQHYSARGHGLNVGDCCFYNLGNGYCHSSIWNGYSRETDDQWDGRESGWKGRDTRLTTQTNDATGITSGLEIGMLLDLDEGSLTVYKNGRKLGIMKRGLAGPYCWATSMLRVIEPNEVRIKRVASVSPS